MSCTRPSTSPRMTFQTLGIAPPRCSLLCCVLRKKRRMCLTWTRTCTGHLGCSRKRSSSGSSKLSCTSCCQSQAMFRSRCSRCRGRNRIVSGGCCKRACTSRSLQTTCTSTKRCKQQALPSSCRLLGTFRPESSTCKERRRRTALALDRCRSSGVRKCCWRARCTSRSSCSHQRGQCESSLGGRGRSPCPRCSVGLWRNRQRSCGVMSNLPSMSRRRGPIRTTCRCCTTLRHGSYRSQLSKFQS